MPLRSKNSTYFGDEPGIKITFDPRSSTYKHNRLRRAKKHRGTESLHRHVGLGEKSSPSSYTSRDRNRSKIRRSAPSKHSNYRPPTVESVTDEDSIRNSSPQSGDSLTMYPISYESSPKSDGSYSSKPRRGDGSNSNYKHISREAKLERTASQGRRGRLPSFSGFGRSLSHELDEASWRNAARDWKDPAFAEYNEQRAAPTADAISDFDYRRLNDSYLSSRPELPESSSWKGRRFSGPESNVPQSSSPTTPEAPTSRHNVSGTSSINNVKEQRTSPQAGQSHNPMAQVYFPPPPPPNRPLSPVRRGSLRAKKSTLAPEKQQGPSHPTTPTTTTESMNNSSPDHIWSASQNTGGTQSSATSLSTNPQSSQRTLVGTDKFDWSPHYPDRNPYSVPNYSPPAPEKKVSFATPPSRHDTLGDTYDVELTSPSPPREDLLKQPEPEQELKAAAWPPEDEESRPKLTPQGYNKSEDDSLPTQPEPQKGGSIMDRQIPRRRKSRAHTMPEISPLKEAAQKLDYGTEEQETNDGRELQGPENESEEQQSGSDCANHPHETPANHPFLERFPPSIQTAVRIYNTAKDTIAEAWHAIESQRDGTVKLEEEHNPIIAASKSVGKEHASIPLYRRFEGLSHRILRYLQDEITQMERQLDALDEQTREYATKRDRQSAQYQDLSDRRKELLSDIITKTDEYHRTLFNAKRVSADFPSIPGEHVVNYRKWLKQTSPEQHLSALDRRLLRNEDDLVLMPSVEPSESVHIGPVAAVAFALLPFLGMTLIREFLGRLLVVGIAAYGVSWSLGDEALMKAYPILNEVDASKAVQWFVAVFSILAMF
ncbi:hypothetical protein KEM55_002440 [Ascosphaera atra]|nr:hypothetical protein KEM55_002440 [Ascosphaera atra]